jgi:hypothetical protein
MGSSAKKKKEKKKDFQVSSCAYHRDLHEKMLMIWLETQAEGRQSETQVLELYGHEFQIKM